MDRESLGTSALIPSPFFLTDPGCLTWGLDCAMVAAGPCLGVPWSGQAGSALASSEGGRSTAGVCGSWRSAGPGQPWEDWGEGDEGRGERPAQTPLGLAEQVLRSSNTSAGQSLGCKEKSQGAGTGQSSPGCGP